MKSEFIRLATLDPIGTARRVDMLEKQRDKLLAAAKYVSDHYLQDERDELELCMDENHHQRIKDLFSAIAEIEETI